MDLKRRGAPLLTAAVTAGCFALTIALAQTSRPSAPQPLAPASPQATQSVQQPVQLPTSTLRDLRPGQYTGVATCAGSSCHGSTAPLEETTVLQNEYFTWLSKDRHAQAFNVLYEPRSALIARNMRIKGEAHKAKLCLDCHTLNVPAMKVAGRIDHEDGVSCEACHGPAGGWLAQHTQEGWTHAQSVAAGMTDLDVVRTRARVCLGCHLGDETKTVDHELIAAGHPRLTFELDNFSATMPPHWRRDTADHTAVRDWAVGQVMNFHVGLQQLAQSARSDKWPEFGVMSCLDCHHNLREGQWRQERGYTMRAGLPQWSPAHWAVLRHVVTMFAPAERARLDRNIDSLEVSVAKMNQPKTVATTAEESSRVLAKLVSRVESAQWDSSRAKRLMRMIATDDKFYEHADLQAAEQAALALQSLSTSVARSDRRYLQSGALRTIDRMFTELQQPHDFNNLKFAALLRELARQLR